MRPPACTCVGCILPLCGLYALYTGFYCARVENIYLRYLKRFRRLRNERYRARKNMGEVCNITTLQKLRAVL